MREAEEKYPKAYLRYYFEKSIEAKDELTGEKIDGLLPGNLKKQIIQRNDLGLKKF